MIMAVYEDKVSEMRERMEAHSERNLKKIK